jgi:cell division initiation protein
MEKFNRTLRGYDPVEVNNFLDSVIKQVEQMIEDSKIKEARINELQSLIDENALLKEKLKQYENMEASLNRAIMLAQKTSDQMRMAAHHETEILVEDAKKNANRIVNEALMRAEKTEFEANMLRRNINIFKRRIKEIIEAQLEVVSEIEKVEL